MPRGWPTPDAPELASGAQQRIFNIANAINSSAVLNADIYLLL
jgi:hypothetical protein